MTRFHVGVQLPCEFSKGTRALKLAPTGPLVASHPELQVQAAMGGLGR
jgi:hypothetical protein